MAASALQQRLEERAAGVGYRGRVRSVPREALRNRKLLHFLEWATEQLAQQNYLSQPQLGKFEDLKRAGLVIEGLELRQALGRVEGPEEESVDHIRSQVSSLEEHVSALKAQLQSLNTVQKHLTEHHATLARDREAVKGSHTDLLRTYQQSLQRAEERNTNVNSSLQDLQSAVDETISYHQRGGAEELTRPFLPLLSQLSTTEYSGREDQYLSQLTTYTRKQFFQGIAVMAHTGENAPCDLLDLEDPGSLLVQGISKEQYTKHCQELLRLKLLYPLVESQCVSDLLTEEHAVGVWRRAEELAAQIGAGDPPEVSLLRQHCKEKQDHLSQLQLKIQQLASHQLPGLIQEMATLHISKVICGDYDLKIARQDYFTSKQDKVISHLLSQTARQELLSMLYEVELRRHQGTHRLLSATATQLDGWREEREKRIRAMQSCAMLPAKEICQTIDSRDQFASRMCSLLGLQPSPQAPLIAHSALEGAVQRLVHRMSALQALLVTMETEQQCILEERISMTGRLERHVFGSSGSGSADLTVKEFAKECSKLESLLSTIEQNVKRLLADYSSKKKALQINSLLEEERKLFVYFFTDPHLLNRAVGDVARRLDAVVTAQESAQ